MTSTMVASWRRCAIGAGLRSLQVTGLHRLGEPFAAGAGVILMFHHVRPFAGGGFAPNRGLEIEPEFLDATLSLLRRRQIDVVSLDEAKRRLANPGGRRFAVLTFDDGYRDNLQYALPILERHESPFAIYVVSGFAGRFAPLWWLDLEMALRTLKRVRVGRLDLPCGTDAEKTRAFEDLYWDLRGGREEVLRSVVRELAAGAGVDSMQSVADLCLDWDEITKLSQHPLCTIGVHTITHPMLSRHPVDVARMELIESRKTIEDRIGKPAVHLAYPIGDRSSAGAREFALASELGFETAVTTRKGMLFPEHSRHLMALPRLSVNGGWQNEALLDILLSGVPFLLWNRGSRVVTA